MEPRNVIYLKKKPNLERQNSIVLKEIIYSLLSWTFFYGFQPLSYDKCIKLCKIKNRGMYFTDFVK